MGTNLDSVMCDTANKKSSRTTCFYTPMFVDDEKERKGLTVNANKTLTILYPSTICIKFDDCNHVYKGELKQ